MRCCIGLVLTLVCVCKVAGAPEIEFENTVADLGILYQHGYTEGTFFFRNIGDDVLRLSAEPECSCTTAQVKSEAVKPGERGEIAFKLHLSELYGDSEKEIHVRSNAGKNPDVVLKIRADTKPLFRCTPEHATIEVPPDTSTNIIIKIERADGEKLNLAKVVPTDPAMKAYINDQSDASGLSTELWIEVPGRKPGSVQTAFSVYESKSAPPDFFVTLTGRVLPYVSATPETVFWGISDPVNWKTNENMTQRRIRIRSNRIQDKISVVGTKCNLNIIAVDLHPIVEGKEYEIVAKMAELPVSSCAGVIEIELDSPHREKLSIPVTVKISGL